MAIPLLAGREIVCSGKKIFPTYWSAAKSSKSLNRYRDKARANVYHCPLCKYWHVGNSMHGDTRKTKYKRRKDNVTQGY